MSERSRYCRARETPSDVRSTPAGHTRPMPEDLLRQASGRLEVLALLASMLWVLAPLGAHLALHVSWPDDPAWRRLTLNDGIAILGLLLSVSVYLYIRLGDRSPATVMDLGLAYLVATSVILGPLAHSGQRTNAAMGINPMITWIGPVTVMTAAILPVPPRKMLVAAFIAASMDPVGMLIARALGRYDFDSIGGALLMHYPSFLLAGVAVGISGVMTRLGQQVSREREMGSYRLGALLGRGGMGEVYHATHRMLARPAAIKLIRPEVLAMADGEAAQLAITRFRREADAAARLRSPHTVALYDFGVTEDNTLFFVMELLEGMDLETLVRQHGPVPAPRAVYILRQVCESLHEAHAAGMVHRDIKPANIHVGEVGLQHDFVKVLDFGLVKSSAQGSGVDSLATAAGLTPGTPAYMAPETASGQPVDFRSDLYALGCVAYYLLTGQLVFEAATHVQMILKHLQETPVPPSLRTGLPVPPALERVVLACLEKQPGDRPAGARELDHLLRDATGEAWSEEDAHRWWTTHAPAQTLAAVPA
jgi:tRNA A-37 threonylcarbamoyl transferase component Bud32